MTTTFNAAATKTVGVNATNFEFTFARLERITFSPGKITTLGAELERKYSAQSRRSTSQTARRMPFGSPMTRRSALVDPCLAQTSTAHADVADQIESGVVFVNQPTWTTVELPFGGVKNSGFGRELSELGFGEFVNRKLINLAPAGLPPSRRVDQSEQGPQP
jgi:hypothetical protein